MEPKLIRADRLALRFPVSPDGQVHSLQDRLFGLVHAAIEAEPAIAVQQCVDTEAILKSIAGAAEAMEDRYVNGMLDPDSYSVICRELAKIAKAAGV